MAFDLKKNFATSLVATAPSPATSGTSLVVTGGEGARFPAVPFNAVVCPSDADPVPENAEVVRVTTRSTDTLTITRATESSTARSVIVGDRIYAGPTAKSFTDVESMAGAYDMIVGQRNFQIVSATAAATYVIIYQSTLASTVAGAGQAAFYLDPADYAVTGMTTKYCVRVRGGTNATQPLITFTIGLYPVSSTAGGNDINTITLGTVTSGSTVAFASPAASTQLVGSSTDFTAPAAGHFALGIVTSATMTTNARASFTVTVLARNV